MVKWLVVALGLFCVALASERRKLAVGDFAELNELLSDALIYLGDISISEGLIRNLSIRNLRCTNFAIADMSITSFRRNGQQVKLGIDIVDLSMDCFMNYNYQTIIFFGSGRASVEANDNDASTVSVLQSSDFDQEPPTSSYIESCSANINLSNLQFLDGGILALAPVEGLLARVVGNQAERTVCKQLENLSTTALVNLLGDAKDTLDGYPADLAIDPLTSERELVVPEKLKLLNLQERETEVGDLFGFALEEIVAFFSKDVQYEGTTDMRANVMMRDLLLEDRALVLNVADFASVHDGILWEKEDKLTDTKIILNRIKLLGLDTLTRFQPLKTVGNYTVQNELSWEYLTFELEATIDIKPSKASNSVLVNPGSTHVVEHITVKFGVENIGAVASFLLAVDQELLEYIQLGALLKADDLLTCIVSTLFKVEIPALSLVLTNIQEPTLEGFVSRGIDRIMTDAALAAFRMYEAVLLKSAPAFFQITVRTAINKVINEKLLSQSEREGCPWVEVESSQTDFIDFRDLLLKPQAATDAGGSGIEPYGDVMSTFFSELNDRFVVTGDDGLPKINSAMRPVTETQSGVPGKLSFTEPFTFAMQNTTSFKSLVKHAEIKSKSISVSNLDTVVLPLQLLDVAGAYHLENSVHLGQVPGRPLSLSTDLLFRIDGDDSPLAVNNLFELTISFQNAVTADILAKLTKQQFLNLPLRDLTNTWCWLAVLPAPDVFDHTFYNGFELSKFGVFIADLDIDFKCISCTSSGGEALPEILAALKESGALFIVEQRLQNLLDELAHSYWESIGVHSLIAKSRKTCPHSPYYDATVSSSFEWPGFPSLSRDAIDSMVLFSALAVNFGMVLTAKSHLLRPAELTDPLSGEQTMKPPMEGQLIDWRDLGGSLGEWATSALDEVRAYVGDLAEDGVSGEVDLQANILVRELLDDGVFSMELNDMSVGGGGINATISRLRILGLDSMLEADVLDVLGAQTLSNRLRFKALRLELDLAFELETTVETAIFSVAINSVDVNMALLLAVEWQELGDMQVGSVLQLRKILPCMVSKFHAINVTQLLVSAGSMDEPQIVGFLSETASEALVETSRRFLNSFSDDLVASIPKICDNTIREVLNHILLEFLANEESYCSFDALVSNDGIIDFRDIFLSKVTAKALGGSGESPYGDTFRLLFQTLQEQISAVDENNQTALNEIIRQMTFEQSNVNGSLIFPGEVFNASGTARISNWIVSMEGRLSDVRIENLDSVSPPINLIQPVLGQPSVLNNSLSMGVHPKPIQFAATLYLALSDDNEMDLQNEVNVVLDINAITLVFTVLLAMSESSFFALSLNHLQDINCWMSAIPAESLDTNVDVSSWFQYGMAAEKANLSISCVSCGSPLFGELVEQLYNPGETEEDVQNFVDEAKDLIDSFLGSDFLQSLARVIVSDAAKLCPASPDYDADATTGDFWLQPETYVGIEAASRDTKMVWFNVANAVVAVVFLIAALVARWMIRRKNRKWLRSLPADYVDLLRRQDQIEAEKEKYLDAHTESMFRSEEIPHHMRYAVPVVVLLNIALYLVGHIALLSYVNIEAQIAGEHFTVEHFLEFTFFGASLRTYRNGGNEMAIFLILFSGVWPYIKLLAALALWFIKPDRLSVARRGNLFLWMDVLTKLSIIDIVTMLIAVAALLVYIGGPGEEFYNSDELYAMTLVIVPQAGFYCIIIAQRLNRVSSRFFLDYHYKIVSVASEEYKRLHRMRLSDQEITFGSGRTFDTAMTTEASFSYPMTNGVSFQETTDNSLEIPSRVRPVSSNARSISFEETKDDSFESPSRVYPVFASSKTSSNSFEEITDNSLGSPLRIPTRRESSDFLFYDPNDRLSEESPPKEVSFQQPSSNPSPKRMMKGLISRLKCQCFRGMMGGTVGVAFAGVFVLILFIIGCSMAPSMSMDAKDVLSVALESGRTYADAVQDFNVFRIVSLILLKTRFVLSSKEDYVGLGILLAVAGLSVVVFPIMQGWKMLQKWRDNRKQGTISAARKRVKPKSIIPGFTNRLKVWHHMEVFVISFCIASWQLGAVVSYLIHNYCDLLNRFYAALGYVGLVERTTSNCFRVQASDPFTLLIMIGSFVLLLLSFVMQAYGQYKRNKEQMEELLLDEEK